MSGQGSTLAKMREIAREDPDAAAFIDQLEADEPETLPQYEWIWRAWHRLSDDRPRYGGGMSQPVPGRIPWAVIMRWADYHGYMKGEMAMMDRCFTAMDLLYIQWWTDQQLGADQ